MKYAAINAHCATYPVALMCRVLEVAPSGFYAWRKQPTPARRRRDHVLGVHVRAAFAASRRRYGSPRVHAELRAAGHHVGRKRVARLMREDGLVARPQRRFVATTQSRHDSPIAPNLLERRFEVDAPNRVWVADLTYLRCTAGFVYLAVVLDLFSRRVVGWAVSTSLTAAVATKALQQGLILRSPPSGLIHHSDRGVHYACDAYTTLLAAHRITPSMSRKGNCWDNAVMERFFLNLKMERVWQRDYANHAEATRDVTEYIVGFYNNVRLHSKLGYLSPTAYEREKAEKHPIGVSENT